MTDMCHLIAWGLIPHPSAQNNLLAIHLAELNSDSMARTTLSSADKNTLRRIMKKVRAIKIEKQRKSKK
jgi:hypothetical protein